MDFHGFPGSARGGGPKSRVLGKLKVITLSWGPEQLTSDLLLLVFYPLSVAARQQVWISRQQGSETAGPAPESRSLLAPCYAGAGGLLPGVSFNSVHRGN